MKLNYKLTHEYKPSFRTEKVIGTFDLNVTDKLEKQWEIDLPIDDFAWNIGIIVGLSGSGKSTLAKKYFGEENYYYQLKWNNNSSFLNDFNENLSFDEICTALNNVGFSSPPNWLLPFCALSNGQKFRVEIARLLLEKKELIIVDEFTSVVDRSVAKISCSAIQKYIKKINKKFVGVSCHYDILEWIEPDWYYDVSENKFYRGGLQRPKIELQLFMCKLSAWQLFKNYHYLSSDICHASKCYVLTFENNIVAFISVMHFCHPSAKKYKKIHRLVVLPDYQGIGFGIILLENVCEIYKKMGYKIGITSSHLKLIKTLQKKENWKLIGKNLFRKISKSLTKTINKKSSNRITVSFLYL